MKLASFVIFCCSALLVHAQGIRPRADIDEYRAHDEQNGIAIAADVMDSEQARHAFASGIYAGYAVVEVAVYPAAGKNVELSSMDFTLRIAGYPSPIRPSDPRTIAGVLHRKANPAPPKPSDVTIFPTVGVEYDSGGGYDPVYGGTRRGGWRTTAGVEVATGGQANGPPPPASTSRDRGTMEAELQDKALPEGPAGAAVAGYLYFPLPSKKKPSDVTSLDYQGESARIHISSPAGVKRK
ncbi:MAG: hypothetical protein ABJF23_06695 [Bryobacteraceae bacterium]